ncbi:MAG TPA: glycosyl hydrolase, partial [Terriglobales bacterium]|nr:glycosyl hydrolase [Terriglobales bacterium]
ITYWGIFNEPNINNLSPTEYVVLYNRTVPAMQTVDSTLKFVAVELSDYGSENTRYVPTFVSNVTAQVDVMATHFYSTCNQRDTDQQLFNTIPDFANRVTYLYSQMATNSSLSNVPVWITENNVNADFDKGGGISACNGTPFVADQRGSSAYFAAWRPYMFSQVGKVGARALYNWVFAGDAQYGELNDQTGNPRLSYWVDYWLAHYFPSPPGSDLLQYSTTDATGMETMAARNPDGSIVVMVVNHAVNSASDNNGSGARRSVSLDVQQLTTSTTAKLLKIDGSTDPINGPSETPIVLTPETQIDFSGYGVAFLTFK